jgi:hypothetical protein
MCIRETRGEHGRTNRRELVQAKQEKSNKGGVMEKEKKNKK